MANIQRRTLRFEQLGNGASFDLPEDWRFVGVSPTGAGVTISNNLTPTPETVTLNDGEPYNQYLPSESFESITVATDGASTCLISYFK